MVIINLGNTGDLYITARMQNTSSYTITKVTMYFEIPLDETATPTKTYNVRNSGIRSSIPLPQ